MNALCEPCRFECDIRYVLQNTRMILVKLQSWNFNRCSCFFWLTHTTQHMPIRLIGFLTNSNIDQRSRTSCYSLSLEGIKKSKNRIYFPSHARSNIRMFYFGRSPLTISINKLCLIIYSIHQKTSSEGFFHFVI